MNSISDDDKGVPLAGRPGLEPDALYVFKLGPIETHEGQCSAYFALPGDGTTLAPQVAESDVRGLAQLASSFQGRRLYCEPRLARAGASHGFVSRPVPPELFPLRAMIALSTQWGPQRRENVSPELQTSLLEAASALWRTAPWDMWTNIEVLTLRLEGPVPVWRELCLLGNGGEEFGFSLYEQPGSVDRFERLSEAERLQDSLQQESLALLFEEEPAWVSTEVRRLTGLPVFPIPLRLSGGEFVPLRQEDLVTLLAVTRALARLSPERLELREAVSVNGLHVTAHVRAHVPLFTAQNHPPPSPAGLLRPEGLERAPAPTVPPPPRRKISQTLLDFVQPLISKPGEGDSDLFMIMLELAVTTWNAVVLDTWAPGQDRVEATRAAVGSLPGELREELLPFFAALVERKRSDFQKDPRLMGGLRVRWTSEGEAHIKLLWRLVGT